MREGQEGRKRWREEDAEAESGWRDLKGGKQRKGLARGRRSHLRARKRFPLSMEV